MTSTEDIVIRGAREHNLRDVSATLPRNQLICFTGVSGSGKSSFAFDTLYAEGQRRYVESLSTYARQFLGQLQKPDVDSISGLSPAISIQQKTSSFNPRSTVGTITQIHDYLRVLYARVGVQHCPVCDQPISAQSREEMIGQVLALPEGSAVALLAPVVRGQKGEHRDLFEDMRRAGYARARIDGQMRELAEAPVLERHRKHDIEIVIDRLKIGPQIRPRLAEALDAGLRLGNGTVLVTPWSTESENPAGRTRDLLLSARYACAKCQRSFEPPSPQMFSFNAPSGMCPKCQGLGHWRDFDPQLLVPDPGKSFLQGAIAPLRHPIGRWRRHIYEGVARHAGIDLSAPWGELPEQARRTLLYGTGDAHITFEWRCGRGVWRHGGPFAGVIAELHEKHRKAKLASHIHQLEKCMNQQPCPECRGTRLNEQARHVRVGQATLPEVEGCSVAEALEHFQGLRLGRTQEVIAEGILKEITARLKFLVDVGLHYLTLERSAPTLSGGEAQRIRLASQIGSGLVGVLYVLDEPSIGLHPRDQQRLLEALCRLRDSGNTVVVVEHDEDTMRAADHIVDFGPGPGVRGGHIVAAGSIDQIASEPRSITGAFLTGREKIEIPAQRRPVGPPPVTASNERGPASRTAKARPRGATS